MAQPAFSSSSISNKQLPLGFCNPSIFSDALTTSSYLKTECHATERNFAFLDIQNLVHGIKERGWKIEWPSFRQYLSKKYNVVRAIVFIGFVKQNQWLYNLLFDAGFELDFKETRTFSDGRIDGGNVDASLAAAIMDYKTEYTKAILVADDADYCRAIQSLNRQNKLKLVISSHLLANTSQQIKRLVNPDMIISIHGLRNQISITTKKK